MGVFTRIERSDLIMFAWGGLIALSMMRVWSSLFFTPIYLFALLALFSSNTRNELWALAGRLYMLLVYFAWASLSLLWAEFPEISWLAVRGDILIPSVALIASFHVFRTYGNAARVEFMLTGAWSVFLVGSALSYLYFGAGWLDKMFDSVGYYSTYVFMLTGMSLPFLSKNLRLVFYPLVVGLLFLTHQRVAWVIFPIVCIADLLLQTRFNFNRGRFLVTVLLVLGFAFGMMKAEQTARQAETASPELKANSAIGSLTKDVRLSAWQEWLERGMESPLIGAGFGRDNVKSHFAQGAEWPDSNLHHGHNVLLNNFLQLGLLGVLLFVLAYSQLLYFLFRQRRAMALAGALVVVLFLTRNMFDDFAFKRLLIVYGLFLGACLQGFAAKGEEVGNLSLPREDTPQ